MPERKFIFSNGSTKHRKGCISCIGYRTTVTLNIESLESAESSPMQYNHSVMLHCIWVLIGDVDRQPRQSS